MILMCSHSRVKRNEMRTFSKVELEEKRTNLPRYRHLKLKILSILKNTNLQRKKVLEIGCGISTYLEYLSSQNVTVGIDLSLDLLKASMELSTKSSFIRSDAEVLPFKNEMFDFVLIVGVLHHLPNKVRALQEIHRVLSNDGGLLMVEPNMLSINGIYVLAGKILTKLLGISLVRKITGDTVSEKECAINIFRIRNLLKRYFRDNHVSTFSFTRLPPIGFLTKVEEVERIGMILDTSLSGIHLLENLGTIAVFKSKTKTIPSHPSRQKPITRRTPS